MSDGVTIFKNRQKLSFLNKTSPKSGQKSPKLKNHKMILLIQFGIILFFGGNFVGITPLFDQNIDQSNPVGLFNSEYVIENLKGDSMGFSKYWKILPGTSLSVTILTPSSISNESVEIVKNAILSTETIDIDNSLLYKDQKNNFSTYYVGWTGALASITETKTPLPKFFEIKNSLNTNEDIVVNLLNVKDRSGLTGFTKTFLNGEHIIKSFITIYDVNTLSKNQLETITRHEFGHALGLVHSSAGEDLMAPTIDMAFPYISHCNLMAISNLYNENSDSTIICEK
jgi:hypothetical protein